MKKVKYTLILFILLSCNLIYAAVPVYTENQKDIIVTAKQPRFIIQLKSNPTTGYSWSLEQYDVRFVKVIKHQYIPSTNKRIGASGVEQWLLALNAKGMLISGKTKLYFAYKRPWEQQEPVQQLVFNARCSACRLHKK